MFIKGALGTRRYATICLWLLMASLFPPTGQAELEYR